MFGLFKHAKFTAVASRPTGTAYFRRRIRAANGEWLNLQRIVPLNGGGLRAYYCGRSGIRAVDRDGVTRVVSNGRDRVWLA
ncbi:MAG: hypothetical protein FJ280_17550 [Planctomycetes bacterium]|nr:hypothetical protein [Planctomycetota bacterium]